MTGPLTKPLDMRPLFRNMASNWAKVFSTNALSTLANAAALAFLARSVEIETLGLISMIQSYVRLIGGVITIPISATLTKFGTEAIIAKHNNLMASLLRLSYTVELASSTFACLVAALGAVFASELFGFKPNQFTWIAIYCLTIPMYAVSTSITALRLVNRFGLAVYYQIVQSMVRFFGAALLWVISAGPFYFILLWIIADFASATTVHLLAMVQYRRINWDVLSAKRLDQSTGSQFWRAVLSSNLQGALRLSTENMDLLLAGYFLGPASAAYLKIGKTLGMLVMQIGWPINIAIAPDLTHLFIAGEKHKIILMTNSVVVFGALIGSLLSLGFFYLGGLIIEILYGELYLKAMDVSLLMVSAYSLILPGVAIQPIMYAAGLANRYLQIHIACTAVFFSVIFLTVTSIGVVTFGIAHLFYNLVWLCTGYLVVFAEIQKVKEQARQ